jgi:hypothetical protein
MCVCVWTNRMCVTLCFTHVMDSRLDWTVWLRWFNVLYLRCWDVWCAIHTAAIKLAVHYWKFLDKYLTWYLVICSSGVKHIWELKEAVSKTYSNMQCFKCIFMYLFTVPCNLRLLNLPYFWVWFSVEFACRWHHYLQETQLKTRPTEHCILIISFASISRFLYS